MFVLLAQWNTSREDLLRSLRRHGAKGLRASDEPCSE
jgi:hypothetical protein